MKVSVGVSNRHIHLNKKDLDFLFGNNYKLHKKNDLRQKGQYSCLETLIIKTNKGRIENVRVLGPIREYTQVEISKTDAYKLGLEPPIRTSGDLKNSETIKILGPEGLLIKENACIIATRHIHISEEDLKKYGFNKDEKVKLKIKGEKPGILENVTFRVQENAFFEVHLDTDDANAFMLKNGDEVEIIK